MKIKIEEYSTKERLKTRFKSIEDNEDDSIIEILILNIGEAIRRTREYFTQTKTLSMKRKNLKADEGRAGNKVGEDEKIKKIIYPNDRLQEFLEKVVFTQIGMGVISSKIYRWKRVKAYYHLVKKTPVKDIKDHGVVVQMRILKWEKRTGKKFKYSQYYLSKKFLQELAEKKVAQIFT